jgi:hypothetical protein
MTLVVLADYPVLQEVLWDNHAKEITEKDAFFYYEARWGYMELNMMTPRELALVNRLTEECGNGIFMTA